MRGRAPGRARGDDPGARTLIDVVPRAMATRAVRSARARGWLLPVGQPTSVLTSMLASILAGALVVMPARAQAQPPRPVDDGAIRRWAADRFVVVAGPAEARLAASLLAAARAQPSFPGLPTLRDTAVVFLAPDASTFRRWVGPSAPEWGAAIAFPTRRVIVMQGRDAGADAGDPLRTLRHELAHLALAEVLGSGVPRWFDEGYASYAAGEWGRDEVLVTSLGLVWRGVPTLAGLDSAFLGGAAGAERGYALAHRAVAELAGLGGEAGLGLLLREWRARGSFDAALRAAHGLTPESFEARFRAAVRRQYGMLALATDLGALSVLAGLLFGPLWWRRRRAEGERLARMRDIEARQAAAERASALARLLGESE